MGWWAADVLGGDEPLDVAGRLEETLGLFRGCLYPPGHIDTALAAHVRGLLEGGGYDRVLAHFALDQPASAPSADRVGDFFPAIVYQVLSVVAMAVGAAVPDELMDRFRWAAEHDPFQAQWPERAQAMAAYRRALDTYVAGTPTVLDTTSLAEALAAHPSRPGG